MNDRELARRFRFWRGVTRACFVAGLALLLARASLAEGAPASRFALGAGVMLVGLTFPLYFRFCNRCPRCDRSFSAAKEFASSETSGLPLFGTIERCPWCGLVVRSATAREP